MKKISVISIIVENAESVGKVNEILHKFSDIIVGRLGLPMKEKNISVICIVVDTDADTLGSLSGKLGMINGVTSKAISSK